VKTTFVRKIKSKWMRKMFPEPTGLESTILGHTDSIALVNACGQVKPEVRCVCVQVLCKNEALFARPSICSQNSRIWAIYSGELRSI
jgi:hypothetical protein